MVISTCNGGWQKKPIARSGAPRRCPAGLGGTGPQGRGTQSNRAKQTQFRRREKQRQVLGGKGVMVNNTSDRHRQNKANFPPQGRSGDRRSQGGAGRAKQSQFFDWGLRIADWGRTCRLRPARAGCTNKPNFVGRPRPWKAKCAKQSQTWAGWGVWETAHPGRTIVQNKANSWDPAGRLTLPGPIGYNSTYVDGFSFERGNAAESRGSKGWREPS
jgi:hypothetical protein